MPPSVTRSQSTAKYQTREKAALKSRRAFKPHTVPGSQKQGCAQEAFHVPYILPCVRILPQSFAAGREARRNPAGISAKAYMSAFIVCIRFGAAKCHRSGALPKSRPCEKPPLQPRFPASIRIWQAHGRPFCACLLFLTGFFVQPPVLPYGVSLWGKSACAHDFLCISRAFVIIRTIL